MTLPIERARSRKPVTWLTLLGVLLLPVLIGGVLVAALYNPTARLDAMSAAIVNDDVPIELDGQLVPMGRQLTAGLVEGDEDAESNLTWTISNPEDAAAGLADGTYDAVVTIPENFSAAAMSPTDATTGEGTPEQATIQIETAPTGRIVDDAITSALASTAASVMGTQLSSTFLENVFLGFTTLGDGISEAADGAQRLADGATTAADGAHTWADGATTAADGAMTLADGIRALGTGADGIASGASGIASGASGLAGGAADLASGATQLATGTTATADGLDTWAAGARSTADGTAELAGGLQQMADQVAQLPAVPQEIVDGVGQIAANSEQIKTAVTDAAAQLSTLAAQCAEQGGSAELCAAITRVSDLASGSLDDVTGMIDQSGAVSEQVGQLAQFGPQLSAALQQSADGAAALAGGMDELADGADSTAAGARQLATGMSGIAAGASQLSGGAVQLSSGASELAGGAGQLASGAHTAASGTDEFAGGITQLGDGAVSLADGIDQLASGAGTLGDGLVEAADSVPSYTDQQAADLASVIADPVAASGVGGSLFGASAVPLLAVLALWFGGLASFIALQAVPRDALTSRRPSVLLAARALMPAAVIGAVQGLLVAVVVQLAAGYDVGTWFGFAGLAMIAGVAFAAVNQALVAVFGGAGRWVAALVGVLAVATGIVSTVPGVLQSIAELMPTTPAYNALLATLTTAGGMGAAIVGMIVWAGLAFVVTLLVVARRRATSAEALLRPVPATV